MLLRNARLILPDGLVRGSLRIRDGKIAEVLGPDATPSTGEEVWDAEGQFIAPGFIDMHIHGALRRDAMDADPEAFATICRYHARGGTTSLALTTITAETESILAVIEAVELYRKAPAADGAQVLGVHIEGPYFSRDRPGAHRLDLIRNPVRAEWEQFLAHREAITQITLAPELPGSLELIEAFSTAGIRVSGGHTEAWDHEAAAGFAHGMRQATHTFNCMSSARRRGPFREAGMLEFALGEPEILCEVIADGRHVSPTLLRILYRAKGYDGIALITDASAGAGLPEGEVFNLGDIACVVQNEVGMTADGRALAGSTANMMRIVSGMVNLGGVHLVEAVRMATLNPAHALGMQDRKGSLEKGMDADCVAFTDDFQVTQTFIAGRALW
ncbi:MAG TPA: N-acetylglucosamine-6-phosphate deacetylase [Chthoniobacteraceae bacterium]|jgi:N-acetylglucosamine-6-phosphate deacetylase|nr:N-acetylglucosamine-6-phosphate deacetylase [Chthoniobacteraceae bacterium]